MVQLVRYTETPVGPYDELVIMPGDFEVPVLSGGGGGGGEGERGKKKVKKNTRITGIWVSQKDTCWNGGSFFAFIRTCLPTFLGGLAGGWDWERENKSLKSAMLTAGETKTTTQGARTGISPNILPASPSLPTTHPLHLPLPPPPPPSLHPL